MKTETFVNMNLLGRTYSQGKASIRALTGVTCEVTNGARIALIGPSGSGKSTLLHLMAGIDTPTEGTVSWPALGRKEELRPRKIGIVFQTMSLLAALTALENAELPLLFSGASADAARVAALKTLTALGLESVAYKLPDELSGGQAQRVAVARALASQPRMILADEPTGQLDHATARDLFNVLLSSLASSDTALVVATHDQTIADLMENIWVVRHGRLEVVR